MKVQTLRARFPGRCRSCGATVFRGSLIHWAVGHRGLIWHSDCPRPADVPPDPTDNAPIEPTETPAEPADEAPGDPVPTTETPVATAATTSPGLNAADNSADPLDVLAVALARRMPPSVDEATVRRLVADEVARRASTVIEIRPINGPAIQIEGAHYLLPRVIRLLAAGLHVYLWGPAGTGKTTAALQAAQALGRSVELDTFDPTTPKSSVLGYRNPLMVTRDLVDDQKALRRLARMGRAETAFSRAYTRGRVFVADEIDNAPASVQTLLNTALANGHAAFAWGTVQRHAGFAFVGTGNTPGRPTPAFPDRRPMSAAFLDRLYFVYWPHDPAIECRAAGIEAPEPPRRVERTCSAAEWVRWVQRVREWAAANAPTLIVGQRAALVGLTALAAGETPEEIAHGLVFRGADRELVDKALRAVPLP